MPGRLRAYDLYRLAWRLVLGLAAALSAACLATPGLAADGRTDQLVRSSDGTVLAVHEWGDRNRPTIVFLHGYLQSYLAFGRQFPALAGEFHIVAFDLRGHGGSDKPHDAAHYREAWRWADDLDAVVKATASHRPVLVGWSMGGRVILEYIEKYGQADIGGLVLVDSGLTRVPGSTSAANPHLLADLRTTDLEAGIAATRAFLHACFLVQPEPAAFEDMLAYNMVVPPDIRTMLAGRAFDFDATLRGITRPTLVIQGERDALIALPAAQYTTRLIPNAQLLVYPGVGHSSFYEAADRFNADLKSFVLRVAAGKDGE